MGGAKAPGMWFRRWRRRRHELPAPVVLPPLERLSELVERVVVLLDQAPAPALAEDEAAAAEEAVVQPPDVAGHVLFLPGAAGYLLQEREGPAPQRGEVLDLDAGSRRVVRVGQSPLPGDRRRCAFLEQEPSEQARTPTGERGEPDRGDEGGPPG